MRLIASTMIAHPYITMQSSQHIVVILLRGTEQVTCFAYTPPESPLYLLSLFVDAAYSCLARVAGVSHLHTLFRPNRLIELR